MICPVLVTDRTHKPTNNSFPTLLNFVPSHQTLSMNYLHFIRQTPTSTLGK